MTETITRPGTQLIGEYNEVVGAVLAKLEAGEELTAQDDSVLWLAVKMHKNHGVCVRRGDSLSDTGADTFP